jgi:hypothetical protein
MIKVQTRRILKLRLLALILALALIWYSLNPAPKTLIRNKREIEPPDERKRNAEPQSRPARLPAPFRPLGETAKFSLTSRNEEDDFEWPEFIDG